MPTPGVYLEKIIIKNKNGENQEIMAGPESKVQPTYNISILSEGIIFSIRTVDINESNKDFIYNLFNIIYKYKTENNLESIGYILFNNKKHQEKWFEVNMGTDVSYAKSLISEELYIYKNRSDV